MTAMGNISRLLSDYASGVVDKARRPARSGATSFSRLPRRLLYLVALILVLSGLTPFVASTASGQAGSASDNAAPPGLPDQAADPARENSPTSSASTSSSTTLTICHIPAGAPWNMHTMTVDDSNAAAHFGHGDTLGDCDAILPETDDPPSPGNSGSAPGQSGDAPANNGGAPGQQGSPSPSSGQAPGNSGNASGQAGSTDDDGPAPANGPSPAVGPADKAAICHIPPGNPANAHTIHVGAASISAHLDHGDSLGVCPTEDTPPVADFDFNVSGLNVTFDASASYDPDGGDIVDYHWSFDDGNETNSGEATTNHTYADNGTYWVTLTVTDDEGDEGATTERVRVQGTLICHVPPGNPSNARNITVGSAALKAHLGHGDHVGACTGDEGDDDGDSVTICHDPSGQNPMTMTFKEGAALDAHLGHGDTLGACDDGPLKPVAAFNWTCEGLACVFDASNSSHPDPNRTIVNWTFSYNPSFYGKVVDITFDASGDYDVTLVVTDDNGVSSDPLVATVTVQAGGGSPPGSIGTAGPGGGGGQAPAGDGDDGEIVPTGGPTTPAHPDPTIVPTGGPSPPGVPLYGAGIAPIDWNWQGLSALLLMLLGGAGLLVAPSTVPGLRNMHWMDRLYFETPTHTNHHGAVAHMHTPERGAIDVHGAVDVLHPPSNAGVGGGAPHQSGAWGSGFA